jgi:CubicO group peptidase (beta-lactamase class C family)
MRFDRGTRLALGLMFSIVAGCVTVRRIPTNPAPPALPPTLDEALAKIERDAAATAKARRWPDMALGLIYDGKLSWWRGYGEVNALSHAPVTEQTYFRYGSITKTLTGLALLQLRDEGKLSLDDPLEKFIPEAKDVVYPTAEHPPIRLRDIVTHQSGLPRVPKGLDYVHHVPTEAELVALLSGLKLEGTPGDHDEYSNYASCLAGVVIHRVSGVSYETWIRTRIAEPLALGFRWSEESVPVGRLAMGHELGPKERGSPIVEVPHSWVMGACNSCSGLYGSLADLAEFAAFEMSAWPPRDAPESPVASRATLRESHMWRSAGYGVNWYVEQDPKLGKVVRHGGLVAGYTAQVWMVPQQGLAVVGLLGFDEDWQELERLVKSSLADLETAFPKLSLVVRAQLQRLLPLLDPGAGHVPDGFFKNNFVDVLKTGTLDDMFELLRPHGGDCHIVEVLEGGADLADVRLECQRGALRLRIVLDEAAPHAINWFHYWFLR